MLVILTKFSSQANFWTISLSLQKKNKQKKRQFSLANDVGLYAGL